MRFHETTTAELEAVLQVHRLAFGQEVEALLVDSLLRDPSAQPSLSLCAEQNGQLAGHALFTALSLVGTGAGTGCSLMAPLAVLPQHQKAGIGRGLIERGCQLLSERVIDLVFVLGDPAYYTRCGFVPAIPHGLHAPYTIKPEAAWMVRPLRPGVLGSAQGTVRCAQALAAEHYWRE